MTNHIVTGRARASKCRTVQARALERVERLRRRRDALELQLRQTVEQLAQYEDLVSTLRRHDMPMPEMMTIRPLLTRRETQIVTMLARGASIEQIAAALGRSPKTVSTHDQSIKAKLGTSNRAIIARWALRSGLVTLDEEQDWKGEKASQ